MYYGSIIIAEGDFSPSHRLESPLLPPKGGSPTAVLCGGVWEVLDEPGDLTHRGLELFDKCLQTVRACHHA